MSDSKVTIPSPERGRDVLGLCIPRFLNFCSQVQSKRVFIGIFGEEYGPDMKKRYEERGFGSVFLNLDNSNQVRFVKWTSGTFADLTFPSIANWIELGKQWGMDKWEEYTEEDVRMVCIGVNELSDWDVYPEDLVWIRKFILYACNHYINDEVYKVKMCNDSTITCFGNAENWFHYYNDYLSEVAQLELCKTLISYS